MYQEAGLVVTIAPGLVLAFLFGFLAALRGDPPRRSASRLGPNRSMIAPGHPPRSSADDTEQPVMGRLLEHHGRTSTRLGGASADIGARLCRIIRPKRQADSEARETLWGYSVVTDHDLRFFPAIFREVH